MSNRFELFTLNYARFKDGMGVPVQASNGRPRYRLSYPLTHAVEEVYPPRSIVFVKPHLPHDEFQEKYWTHLASVGVGKLASRFRAVATAAGDHRLVLLCFEAIDKGPENWCHRTMFARWWTNQTGDEVRELGPGPTEPDLTLFD